MSAAPCSTCPWRKSSTIGGADIPGFSIEMMRGLRRTVGAEDGFRSVMACHGSKEGKEIACRGYLFIEGWKNINVRLMASRGEIDPREIEVACADIEMWGSFEEMLAAYEEVHRATRSR